MKKCPYCAEEILEDAIKCKHCKESLSKDVNNITKKEKEDNKPKFPFIFLGIYIIYIILQESRGYDTWIGNLLRNMF